MMEEERGGRGGRAAAPFGRQRRPRPPKDLEFDYKDVEMLRRFVSERGKVVPRHISRLSATQQRRLATAVKRARILALLPFADD